MKRMMCVLAVGVLFFGCGKDNEPDLIELSTAELSVGKGESVNINAKSRSQITYTIENDYYAEITDKGVITGNFVGETSVNLRNASGSNKDVLVKIKPKYTTYVEPDMDFGFTASQLQSKYGFPRFTSATGVIYAGKGNVLNVVYLLTSNRVSAIGIFLPGQLRSEVNNYIKERYAYGYESESGIVYSNALSAFNSDYLVAQSTSENGDVMVLYFKNPSKARGENKDIEHFLELLKKNSTRNI